MGRKSTHTHCTAPGCANKHRAKGLCSTHYNQRAGNRPSREVKDRRKVPHTCQRCGAEFMADPCYGQRFCSPSCGAKSPWGRRARARAKLRAAARGARGSSVWQQATCQRCGDPFVSSAVRGARFCSADCQRREKTSERRARERGAFVARVSRHKIFERDAWTCQLCGYPVDRAAQAPEDLAPTIDHIIPLANGGTHEPANVQTAHFICNSTKSNRR